MRKPCKECGSLNGEIRTKNGQDVVYCECGKHGGYNAPKTETGRKERSISTVHAAITGKQRSAVIDRAHGRCERCGKPAEKTVAGMHVGHVIPVEFGFRNGMTDKEINSLENLIAECDECNIPHGKEPLPVRLILRLIKSRLELET